MWIFMFLAGHPLGPMRAAAVGRGELARFGNPARLR